MFAISIFLIYYNYILYILRIQYQVLCNFVVMFTVLQSLLMIYCFYKSYIALTYKRLIQNKADSDFLPSAFIVR
jgi:hypothetical protein